MVPIDAAAGQAATSPAGDTSHASPAPAPNNNQPVRIGVGIDTARYGHYAAFLRADLEAAAGELPFVESADGYAQLRQRLEDIVARCGKVHFVVRLDAAGQYADNLLHFLHRLASADASDALTARWSISCGDPQRNKNYRAALFGGKKSDPVEARAAARFALSERPTSVTALPRALRTLRQVAGRLQAVVRQRTRLINQFHHLLALTFPELALLVKDISAGWVLELCARYPTAKLLADASADDLGAIAYLSHRRIDALLRHARGSVASLHDAAMAELVRDQVRQLRDVAARQKRLENLLVSVYRQLPEANHLASIPGFGEVTAAILTAFILDIERFETPGKLVAYFGVLPIEAASGAERDGRPRAAKRYVMSRRGNDLVRRYLWMAALSAIRCNPAIRALYRRVVAKHPEHKAIAVGHAMRKLLHLAFAIWKTGKPFAPGHYSWDAPAHLPADAPTTAAATTTPAGSATKQRRAAGHTLTAEPAQKVVTATRTDLSARTVSLAAARPAGDHLAARPAPLLEAAHARTFVDFAHLKRQLPIARLLDHLGLATRLSGVGPQRRGPCPIHRGDARGRSFSVHLDDHVFVCFDSACAAKGDVIDLWAAVNGMSQRQAALDLVETFGLEPAPRPRTAKRKA
jgi:transposase